MSDGERGTSRTAEARGRGLEWVAEQKSWDTAQPSPKFPGSVPFSVKETGDGLPHQSPRHNVLTGLVPSSMVCWRSQGPQCLPAGHATPMMPQPPVIENGTDPGNFDESPIPRRGRRAGRNGGAVGYNADLDPDKRRPCSHWCGGQPVDVTGSGQACGDNWWLRSGWAETPLSWVL